MTLDKADAKRALRVARRLMAIDLNRPWVPGDYARGLAIENCVRRATQRRWGGVFPSVLRGGRLAECLEAMAAARRRGARAAWEMERETARIWRRKPGVQDGLPW